MHHNLRKAAQFRSRADAEEKPAALRQAEKSPIKKRPYYISVIFRPHNAVSQIWASSGESG
jgi:hypothetical protein